jgi:O-antigen/teichoic acid export membrane protein
LKNNSFVLKKYINNISALQYFQLFRFGILFLISICFAKSHLNTTEIGIFEKLIFLSGAISFFWVNGLIQSLLPLYNNNKTFSQSAKNPILFNVLVMSVLFSLVFAAILLFTEKSTAQFLISSDEIPYKWLFILFFVISTPSFLLEYVYLLRNKPNSIILYSTLTFSLQFLLVVIPIWLGFGIKESLFGLISISALRFVWLVVIVFKHSEISISFTFIKEHLSLAFPLIAGALISGSMTYIDGIIVSNHFDNSTFAVYRYGARELPLAMLLANAFSNAMIPEFSIKNNLAQVLKKLKQKSTQLMHVLFPLSIVLILCSKWLFPVIFNPDFIEGSGVFNVFLLLIISRLVFPQTILMGLKKTRALLFISIAEFIIKLSLSLWLVTIFGIVGVALGSFIAYLAEKIILITYNYHSLKLLPSSYINFKWLSIYSLITIVVYLFAERHFYGINF